MVLGPRRDDPGIMAAVSDPDYTAADLDALASMMESEYTRRFPEEVGVNLHGGQVGGLTQVDWFLSAELLSIEYPVAAYTVVLVGRRRRFSKRWQVMRLLAEAEAELRHRLDLWLVTEPWKGQPGPTGFDEAWWPNDRPRAR